MMMLDDKVLCCKCREVLPFTVKSEIRTTDYGVSYKYLYAECDICHERVYVPGLDDDNMKRLDKAIEIKRKEMSNNAT